MNRSDFLSQRETWFTGSASTVGMDFYVSPKAAVGANDGLHSGEYFIQKAEEAAARANRWLWLVVVPAGIAVIYELIRVIFT